MPGPRQSVLPLVALLLFSLTWAIAGTSYAQATSANSATASQTPGSSFAKKPSNGLGGKPADGSTEITTVGCKKGGSAYFFDDSGAYTLVGSEDLLLQYGDDWVMIRGRILPQTGGQRFIEIISQTKVAEAPAAILDPALRKPSGWHTYSNETLGVRFAFPKEFDPVTENNDSFELRPSFIKNDNAIDLNRSNIPSEIYVPQRYPGNKRTRLQSENPPQPNFFGGAFGVFVNPQITSAATCKQFDAEIRDADISSRTIKGIHYTLSSSISASAGAGESYDSFHTFQNGRCFGVDFILGFSSSGLVDVSCSIADADGDALEALLLSKISFFQPKSVTSIRGQ
jgi:hypothetical protein